MKDPAFTDGLGAGLVLGVWINIIVFGIFSLADNAPTDIETLKFALDTCWESQETAMRVNRLLAGPDHD